MPFSLFGQAYSSADPAGICFSKNVRPHTHTYPCSGDTAENQAEIKKDEIRFRVGDADLKRIAFDKSKIRLR